MLKQNRNKKDKKKASDGGGDDDDDDDDSSSNNRRPVAPAGPAFTVQLEISYKKIVPAGSTVVVEATIESIEGRKMWLAARVLSGVGGAGEDEVLEHSRARALFVVPRDWKEESAEGDGNGVGAGGEVGTKTSTAKAVGAGAVTASSPRRAHSIEDDVLTEAGVERLALAAAAAAKEKEGKKR